MAQIKDLKRMCEYYSDCEGCPFHINCTSPDNFSDDTDEIVDNWVKEHPVKTYAMDFFEKFPDAPRCKSANGRYPSACRKAIYDGKCPGVGCEECWNEPLNDE